MTNSDMTLPPPVTHLKRPFMDLSSNDQLPLLPSVESLKETEVKISNQSLNHETDLQLEEYLKETEKEVQFYQQQLQNLHSESLETLSKPVWQHDVIQKNEKDSEWKEKYFKVKDQNFNLMQQLAELQEEVSAFHQLSVHQEQSFRNQNNKEQLERELEHVKNENLSLKKEIESLRNENQILKSEQQQQQQQEPVIIEKYTKVPIEKIVPVIQYIEKYANSEDFFKEAGCQTTEVLPLPEQVIVVQEQDTLPLKEEIIRLKSEIERLKSNDLKVNVEKEKEILLRENQLKEKEERLLEKEKDLEYQNLLLQSMQKPTEKVVFINEESETQESTDASVMDEFINYIKQNVLSKDDLQLSRFQKHLELYFKESQKLKQENQNLKEKGLKLKQMLEKYDKRVKGGNDKLKKYEEKFKDVSFLCLDMIRLLDIDYRMPKLPDPSDSADDKEFDLKNGMEKIYQHLQTLLQKYEASEHALQHAHQSKSKIESQLALLKEERQNLQTQLEQREQYLFQKDEKLASLSLELKKLKHSSEQYNEEIKKVGKEKKLLEEKLKKLVEASFKLFKPVDLSSDIEDSSLI